MVQLQTTIQAAYEYNLVHMDGAEQDVELSTNNNTTDARDGITRYVTFKVARNA